MLTGTNNATLFAELLDDNIPMVEKRIATASAGGGESYGSALHEVSPILFKPIIDIQSQIEPLTFMEAKKMVLEEQPQRLGQQDAKDTNELALVALPPGPFTAPPPL